MFYSLPDHHHAPTPALIKHPALAGLTRLYHPFLFEDIPNFLILCLFEIV